MNSASVELSDVRAEAFRDGMRRLTGAVTLVTANWRGVSQGLTATAVCSLSAVPPRLLVCVNRNASAHDPISEARCFAVNVLAADQQDLARRFSDSTLIAERFATGVWTRGLTGAPLLEGALATFDCVVDQWIAAGTHTIFIGMVKDVRVSANPSPLLYHDGQFGTWGKS